MTRTLKVVAKPAMPKRKFTAFTLQEAMGLIPTRQFVPWKIVAETLEASDILQANLERLQGFDLMGSEAAKLLLVDTVLAEVLARHPRLKAWKGRPLETDTLTGFADYLIAERLAFLKLPYLCVVEAKKDDFEQGGIQCVAEMVACRWNSTQAGALSSVYGIVSNGTSWQFYSLTPQNALLQSDQYAIGGLQQLLGVLDHVFGECAKNVVL